MRIPSGVTDQVVYFKAVDSTDFTTAETGLTTFTVYRSRNGAAAAAMTTPTVTEVDATNMPGVYKLLLDEDMTIGAGNDSEEMVFHITQASMAPVTRTVELYRPKITVGETLNVSSGVSEAAVQSIVANAINAAAIASNAITDAKIAASAITAAKIAASAITADKIASNAITSAKIAASAIGSSQLATNAIGAGQLASTAVSEIQSGLATASALATVDSNVDAILVDTGSTLPSTLSTIDTVVDGIQADLSNGTDGLGAIKADTAAILVDTNELQGNQGDWATATGFATSAALATVDSNVDAILVDTGTTLPATLSTIDTVVDGIQAAVNSGTDGLSAIKADTAAILVDTGTTIPGQITALNDLSAADVNAQVDTALADYDAPTKAEMDSAFTEIKGATFSGATDSLEAIRDRGDAAWTTGAGGSSPTAADIRAEIDTNSTQLAAILADTNELQSNQGDWATATGFATSGALATVDANVDAILVDTGTTIPGQITGLNNLSAADVNAEVDTALSDYDAPTKAELDAAFTEIKGATFSGATDSLEAIRDRGDSAWTTGAGGSSPSAADIRAEIDSNSTQLAAILADTNELQLNQGDWATATGFATSGDLATVDANVDAILGDTGTTLPAQIGALNNLSAADVNAEVDTALSDIHLDHLFATAYDATAKPGAAAALLNELVEDDAGTTRYTVNALENGPSGSGSSAAAIADAVWTEALADHSGTAGSTAEALDGAGGGGGGLDAAGVRAAIGLAAANLDTQLGSIDTNVDAVLTDTSELQANQGDWATATGFATSGALAVVDSNVDAILVDTGGLNDLSAAEVRAAVGLSSADLDTQLAALPTAIENADALLNRDMAAVSDTNARTPLNALRFLRNKWSVTGATLTVTKEDDVTAAYTATLTADAAANPVVGSDPA